MMAKELIERMSGGLFMSTMLNLTDAEYAVSHARGAKMVQLGTMLVAPEISEYVDYRRRWPNGFLPYADEQMVAYLRGQVATVRQGLGDAAVCLSIAGFDLGDVLRATRAAREAGVDFVELNAHGRVEPMSGQGYLSGMSRHEYRERLVTWAQVLAGAGVPIVVKFNTLVGVDLFAAVNDLAAIDVLGFHFNVRSSEEQAPNLEFVEAMRQEVDGALLCSGHAYSAEAIRALYAAGADAVGVAQPLIKDEEWMPRMVAQLG
jgi:tRNA-dihydrouridine synthase